MRWLNEQIDNLRKIKIGSSIVLQENIKDPKVDEQYKAEILNYFVKKLNENKKIGDFEFEYDPSEGIFKFISEIDGVVVKATPFYNDHSGFPVEVFDKNQTDSHIFIEQREFNVENILFEKYMEIMEKFLIEDADDWFKKVNKFDKQEEKDSDKYFGGL